MVGGRGEGRGIGREDRSLVSGGQHQLLERTVWMGGALPGDEVSH